MGIWFKLAFGLAIGLLLSMDVTAQVVRENVEEEPVGLIESRIEDALQNVPFQVGAFRIRPRFSIFGEYNSNSLLLSDEETDDISLQATPGVVAILPFRKRALLEIFDEVSFLYYRDVEELRGAFNTAGARFTIGGRRLLFTIADEFSIRRVQPTFEFDFPTDVRNNSFDSFVTLGLGLQSEVRFGVASSTASIAKEIVNPTGVPLSSFFDQRSTRVVAGMKRQVKEYTSIVADFYYEDLDFAEESLQPDAKVYVLQGGFSFRAKGKITGDAILGYKSIAPDVEEEADYKGLIGRGSVNVRVGERTTIGLEYIRDARPSVTDGNWFFLENRIAPSVEFYVTRRFSIFGLVSFSSNTYPRLGLIVNSDGLVVPGEVDDSSKGVTVALRYKIGSYWQFFVSGSTYDRTSNAPNAEKQRNLVSAGATLAF